jgi:hypothetical protein
VLNVSDNAGIDTGSMRRFSLIFNSGNAPEELAAPASDSVPPLEAPPAVKDGNAPAGVKDAAPKADKPSEEQIPGIFEMLSNLIFGPAPEPVRAAESGWSASRLSPPMPDLTGSTRKARHRPAG